MKFIIGLGNPGTEYEKSRHNVGFMVIDRLADRLGLGGRWQNNQKLKAQIIKDGELVLIKPQDYMNNSGLTSRQVINFYEREFKVENVIVIHDDLDIALGEFKIQLGKGPKVHNGLLDLDRHLSSSNYWHVRVGVDNRSPELSNMSGADYVLANFLPAEAEKLRQVGQTLIDQLKDLIDNQV